MKIVPRQNQPFVDRVIVISQDLIVFNDLDIVNSLLSKNCRRGLRAGSPELAGNWLNLP
jgi:hypothetical protein